jgi:hypothetical protein
VKLDPVEAEYVRAIDRASSPDEAMDLAIGLRQYREMFKERPSVHSAILTS